MDKLQNEFSSLKLDVKSRVKDQLLDEINHELAKIEITSKAEVKDDLSNNVEIEVKPIEDDLKVEVKIEPIDNTSNVEVNIEPTDKSSDVEIKVEPTLYQDVSKVEFKVEPTEGAQLKEDDAKYVEVESESDSYDESEESEDSDDESEKITRGPIRTTSRNNFAPYPYNIPPEHHQYINYQPQQPGLPRNIPPLIIPTPEEQRSASSQLLLSGGSQIEEISPEIEAAEVNQLLQSLISDDSPSDWPLEFFENINLADFDATNENDIFEDVIGLKQDYNLDQRNNNNNTSFLEIEPNSPYSTGSSDQVVYSPHMSTEEFSPPPLYPSPISPFSDIGKDFLGSLNIVQTNEKTLSKCVRILPKPSNEILNRNCSIKTNERKIGPRNKYLNLEKNKRDEYHRRMLALSEKGLGTTTRDGYTILHTLIADRKIEFAIYFLDILKLWLSHDDNAVKLRGIESIHSFVDTRNNQGQTALYLAAMLNQDIVVECLIDLHKANVHLADYENGDTPFHVVCRSGETFSKVLKAFCTHKDKFDLQVVNKKGRTGLHEAVRCHEGLRCHCENDRQTVQERINNVGIVKQLLHAGAAIDVQDEDGFTPIHFAVKNKCLTLLDVMYENGALCNFDKALLMVDNMGRTPSMLACQADDEISRIVLQEKLCLYETF